MPQAQAPVYQVYQVYPVNSVLPPDYQPPCRHRHRSLKAALPCRIKAEQALTHGAHITYALTALEKGQRRHLNPAEIAECQELFPSAMSTANQSQKAKT